MNTKEKEEHYIEPFRGEDITRLGVIRLKHLACPEKSRMKILIGDKEFKPIGFDTYGHPVISRENFDYYKALKSIAEREGKYLAVVVEYDKKVLCLRKDVYDSVEGIEKSLMLNCKKKDVEKKDLTPAEIAKKAEKENEEKIKILKSFKELLINRKQAAFNGEKLNTFIVFNKYVLADDGRIYECEQFEIVSSESGEKVEKEVYGPEEFNSLICGKEAHIPSEKDVCAVCGKNFTIEDIKNCLVSEDEECEKVHTECHEQFTQATNYMRASKIIDAVYTDAKPISEVGEIYDSEDAEMKTCYKYKTKQGTIQIYFRTKVTVIVWHDNFKPFNMDIFEKERVTKGDRFIHAWSIDDAIKYLQMAKKA